MGAGGREGEGIWGMGGGDVYLQTEVVLLLLLVNDTQSKVNLADLFKLGIHLGDRGKGFFGVLNRAISIIQYANAVPELGVLFHRVTHTIISFFFFFFGDGHESHDFFFLPLDQADDGGLSDKHGRLPLVYST